MIVPRLHTHTITSYQSTRRETRRPASKNPLPLRCTFSNTDFVSLDRAYFHTSHLYTISVFPPFWFIGSFILFTPLRAPEGRELTKTMGEGLDWISSMRKIELKWARRCLIASVVLLVLVLVITVAVWRVVNA